MLLERRTRALQRHLPSAIRGDHRGVHQARVATRRLREAVPVLTVGAKGAKAGRARRKIRRLTRALGTVRELDVTVHILDELARRSDIPRNALEDVRTHVVTERDRRRDVMLERLDQVNSEKLGRRLREVATALAESNPDGWRNALSTRLVTRAKRFREVVQAAGHVYAPEALHQVRISAKKLRYALELAADAGIAVAKPLVSALKRIQDTLGRLHDLQVLQRHVGQVQAQPPSRRGSSESGLSVLSQALEAECRHLHARYLAAVPALLDVSDACRSTVVPQLANPLRRVRHPLKMAMSASASTARRAAAGRA